MKNGKILDCTLRDGAYLLNKKFGERNILGIIDGLQRANIDLIEIGFLQDTGMDVGKTVYFNSKDAAKVLSSKKSDILYTVLADFSRYTISNLDINDGRSFDAVRACFFKHERFDVIDFCRAIKEKGYKVFVQPVDIMGYTENELLDLIQAVNTIEPYCFSIVDTFGSMYLTDLRRIYSVIHKHLISSSAIGFHSHNNMQMSNALSQEFLSILDKQRLGIIDATLSGMGRGAGNTPTELIAQYMNQHLSYNYNMDVILDIIDNYMENIRSRCIWGYSTDYFIAGCYSAHVNNIGYLKKKNSIRSRDIKHIINSLNTLQRKRYDYDLLESLYIQLLKTDIDDNNTVKELSEKLHGKNIVIIAPGKSVRDEKDIIRKYIKEKQSIVININFLDKEIDNNYIYINNIKRYDYWKSQQEFIDCPKIITSNITTNPEKNMYLVSFLRLFKSGWLHNDNSTLMLLRLLDEIHVKSIGIAGLDGYGKEKNYYSDELSLANTHDHPDELNKEISSMLKDYFNVRKHKDTTVEFITQSIFQSILLGGE
ncbi:aldolase catalytic domain-containing protein [Lachnoclostridium edouardi]|uniref:aldolase catalytic domain-containing protein n=1 Tax=Lachnoclostridium edouardi TaxID=1926283 RepID=UPI000C7AB834|nr:aldolase catalytic domain-containing protein [Lachnoclostridium edouardi]